MLIMMRLRRYNLIRKLSPNKDSFYSRYLQGLIWTIKSQYVLLEVRNYEDVRKKNDYDR